MNVYLTDADVAERFDKSVAFVQRTCRAGLWPHMKVGKSYRFKAEHVAAIEALCEVQPQAQSAESIWDIRGRAS